MSVKMLQKPLEILLVEDNLADVRLLVEVLKEGKEYHNMHVVSNGVEALSYLNKRGKYSDAPRPDIILLDLNLPKKDGREVLKEIKTDKKFKRIPVIVLTTSHSEDDILKSYEYHANCYITKPVDLDQFIAVVNSIEDLWLEYAELPQE
jgi:two-component system, chemotaxis family, response regulator Rcp1